MWYGNTQNFGQPGTPQEWFNILGSVSGTPPVTSLKYSLNNGPDQTLSIGPDGLRLTDAGDFNIELYYTDLNDGANTVLIKASDGSTQTTRLVTVNYDAGNIVPLPFTADWNAGSGIQSNAQVVDGKWVIDGEQLETVAPGYDRLVTLGSMTWTDYEVEVPVTVHSLNPASTQGSGVGLIVRWLGHYDTGNGAQPNAGWRRLGAMAWYRWTSGATGQWEVRGHGGVDIITPQTDRPIEFDLPYIFKLGVQSSTFAGKTATYRFKFWPAGEPEPPQWYLTGTGNNGEPLAGSVVLVAHHAMVSWGNVIVRPITNKTFTINVQQPASGSIAVTPNKQTYSYGETVEIRAQGQGNYVMQNWTGSFSGNQNPIVFDITENVTVGAVFELGAKPKLNITTSGQGTVEVSPQRANDLYTYGELVMLTPKPQLGYIFAGWTGSLTGANNPAVIVMDSTKNITANFISSNPNSPISDDFNACTLNTNLWSFVNPVGDGTYSLDGQRLLLNVPANVSHNIWADGNRSVRMMQPTQNVDFEIVAKFESAVAKRYQMQGVIIEQDSQNYLRFEVHFDGTSNHLYVDRIQNGNPKAIINQVYLTATPPYLRITRAGPLWSFSSSNDGQTWLAAGSFNYPLTATRSGVFGANHGTLPNLPAPAHTAIVDFFFNSARQIVPEDSVNLDNLKITVDKVGQGTVTLNPAKAGFTCGEKVTLTASPAAGWIFSSWSGDLSGTNPSQQLTVVQDYAITAIFSENPIESCFNLSLDHGGQGSDPTASPANSSGCSAGKYTAGQSITLMASPAIGWRVKNWSGTATNSSMALINTITMPAADHAVSVQYELIPGIARLAFLPAIFEHPCFTGPNEIEPNNGRTQAAMNGVFCFNRTYRGLPNDQWDVFAFDMVAPGVLTAVVENHPGPNVVLLIPDADGTALVQDDDATDGLQVSYNASAPGRYYIVLHIPQPNAAQTAEYMLRVSPD